MQLCRCPICHGRIHLEALVQDEAGRELLGLLSKLDTNLGTALVTYLGLFRSASRDLANDRALRLLRELIDLDNPAVLATALAETVESMREKQRQGGWKPLSNHNYVKKVLDSVRLRGIDQVQPVTQDAPKALLPKSKTGGAMMALEALKHGQ